MPTEYFVNWDTLSIHQIINNCSNLFKTLFLMCYTNKEEKEKRTKEREIAFGKLVLEPPKDVNKKKRSVRTSVTKQLPHYYYLSKLQFKLTEQSVCSISESTFTNCTQTRSLFFETPQLGIYLKLKAEKLYSNTTASTTTAEIFISLCFSLNKKKTANKTNKSIRLLNNKLQ